MFPNSPSLHPTPLVTRPTLLAYPAEPRRERLQSYRGTSATQLVTVATRWVWAPTHWAPEGSRASCRCQEILNFWQWRLGMRGGICVRRRTAWEASVVLLTYQLMVSFHPGALTELCKGGTEACPEIAEFGVFFAYTAWSGKHASPSISEQGIFLSCYPWSVHVLGKTRGTRYENSTCFQKWGFWMAQKVCFPLCIM